MTQNIGEIVTVVAIALIGLIFTVYLIVLRRNGWLGGKPNFYRCPNKECKNIFKKPIELKDLSANPPRKYPACPECGTNLDSFFSTTKVDSFFSSVKKKIHEIRSKPLSNQKKIEIKPIAKVEAKKVKTINQKQEQLLMPNKNKPTTKTTTNHKKPDIGDDSRCEYSFGYLSTLNIKKDPIPLKCLECPKTLDCLQSKYK